MTDYIYDAEREAAHRAALAERLRAHPAVRAAAKRVAATVVTPDDPAIDYDAGVPDPPSDPAAYRIEEPDGDEPDAPCVLCHRPDLLLEGAFTLALPDPDGRLCRVCQERAPQQVRQVLAAADALARAVGWLGRPPGWDGLRVLVADALEGVDSHLVDTRIATLDDYERNPRS